jgi:hypothetical protein
LRPGQRVELDRGHWRTTLLPAPRARRGQRR